MMKMLSRFCLALLAVVSISMPLAVGIVSADARQDLIDKAQCEQNSNAECFEAVQDPALNQDCTASTANCNVVAKYINPAIALLGILGGIAVTIGIIVGGIQYASSGGDPQKAAAGKQHIKMAVIALLGMLFLYAFIRFLMPAGTSG